MKSAAYWIGAATLLILIARGQALPAQMFQAHGQVDLPPSAEEQPTTIEWERDETAAEEAPAFTNITEAKVESNAPSLSPVTQDHLVPDESPLTSEEEIFPSHPPFVQTSEDVTEAKTHHSLITAASDLKDNSFSQHLTSAIPSRPSSHPMPSSPSFSQHITSAIPSRPSSHPMSSSPSSSQDTVTTSVKKSIGSSTTTPLQTPASTVLIQEQTSEHKLDGGSKIEPTTIADIDNRLGQVDETVKPLHDVNFTTANPPHSHVEHPLSGNELLSSVQTSTGKDIGDKFEPYALPEERSSKHIKIEADDAPGNATDQKPASASTKLSSDPNTLLFTALTLAVAVNGITTLSSSELTDHSFVDTPTSKATSPSATSTPLLSQTSEQLPSSSLVGTSTSKDSSPSLTSTSPLSQTSAELPDKTSADTTTLRDSTASVALSTSPLSEASAGLPDTNILGNIILKDVVSSLPSSTTTKLPKFSSNDASINKADAAEMLSSDYADNALSWPLETRPLLSEETPEAADVLMLPDIGDDDMDMAATMIFRPAFSYRQDSARRRFFRSLADQR